MTDSLIQFSVSEDVALAGEVFGHPEGTPLVFLPGGGQTRHSWRSTAKRLGNDGWYAITIDLRGHGDSEWASGGSYGLNEFSGDVKAIADSLSVPPVLIGASLGGLSALAAAGECPNIARALVLVDVTPSVQAVGTKNIRDFMASRPDGFSSLDEAAHAIDEFLPSRKRRTNVEGLEKNLRCVAGRWYWHWDPEFLRSVDSDTGRTKLIDTARLEDASTSLRIPTLLIRGRKSDMISDDDARRFVELVPHAEFADIPSASHMVVGDNNEAFEEELIEFLNRRVRRRQRLLEDQSN